MRDWNRSAIAIAGLALTTFAVAAGAQAKGNQAKEEAAIRAAQNEYMAAFNGHDADRLATMHTSDAMVMISNSPLASGTSAIRSSFADFFKSSSPNLSFSPTKIDVASPTVATDVGTYTLTFDTPQGKVTDKGNYATVWHKVNGQWRIAVDAPVSTTPLEAMAAMAPMPPPDVHVVANSAIAWSDFTPPGFDPGMKLAVISGDPGKPGEYTLRLMFPAGYQFPVHYHPGAENLTVVSGTFQLGMGNTADANAIKNYGPGDYLYIPPRHAHFGGSATSGPSVVQLHGEGPFQVIVGAPK
jgi:uncharacterized protein (TIGR02246 family)